MIDLKAFGLDGTEPRGITEARKMVMSQEVGVWVGLVSGWMDDCMGRSVFWFVISPLPFLFLLPSHPPTHPNHNSPRPGTSSPRTTPPSRPSWYVRLSLLVFPAHPPTPSANTNPPTHPPPTHQENPLKAAEILTQGLDPTGGFQLPKFT